MASDLGLEDDLHDVQQAIFGGQDYHLYRFTTGPEQEPGDRLYYQYDYGDDR